MMLVVQMASKSKPREVLEPFFAFPLWSWLTSVNGIFAMYSIFHQRCEILGIVVLGSLSKAYGILFIYIYMYTTCVAREVIYGDRVQCFCDIFFGIGAALAPMGRI